MIMTCGPWNSLPLPIACDWLVPLCAIHIRNSDTLHIGRISHLPARRNGRRNGLLTPGVDRPRLCTQRGRNLDMSRLVLIGIALTLVLAMPPASAFCQAAAESVLLNGASSSSAVKAGSALNSALNGASKRLGARIPQVSQTSPSEVHHPLLLQAHPQTQETEMKNGAGSVSQP